MNCKKLLALLLAALLTMALLAGCGPNAGEATTPSESQAPSETAGGETAPTSERTHVKNLVVGITGSKGGAMASLCDVSLALPAEETYQVQDLTLPVYHALCAMADAALFKE